MSACERGGSSVPDEDLIQSDRLLESLQRAARREMPLPRVTHAEMTEAMGDPAVSAALNAARQEAASLKAQGLIRG